MASLRHTSTFSGNIQTSETMLSAKTTVSSDWRNEYHDIALLERHFDSIHKWSKN